MISPPKGTATDAPVSRACGEACRHRSADAAQARIGVAEDLLHAVRATAADFLRDGFGPQAGFAAFVAEAENARAIVGMATCSRRVVTGGNGPVVFLQDLFVEPELRQYGVAGALVAAMQTISAARSSSSWSAPTTRRGFLPAKRICAPAAEFDLHAGRTGTGDARSARQGRPRACRLIPPLKPRLQHHHQKQHDHAGERRPDDDAVEAKQAAIFV
jgi:GNAT superfamily N-acetyltransferase